MAEFEQHLQRAWSFFTSLGSPKLHVAPMVDQSELPFRMLCRRHGATAAYTPMLHSRLFAEDEKYRAEMFSTCAEDRPLFVQFCSNDPEYLVKAARIVEPHCDAIDLNFGCPQRIAKRGYYGAFLMDNLPLIEDLVRALVKNVNKPISCKIRIFPELQRTIEYAKMIERAGCSVLAVHGRTREMKNNTTTRADWDAIRAVKAALRIPVLANGNIRDLADAEECMRYTGCDGVLSAESLLEDPALFSPRRALPEGRYRFTEAPALAREYLQLCQQHPVPLRMVKGHLFKILNPWLQEFVDLRHTLGQDTSLGLDGMMALVEDIDQRIAQSGRDHPQPTLSERQLARMEKEAALKAAIEEQEREAAGLAAVGAALVDAPQAQAAVAVAGNATPTAPCTQAQDVPQPCSSAIAAQPSANARNSRIADVAVIEAAAAVGSAEGLSASAHVPECRTVQTPAEQSGRVHTTVDDAMVSSRSRVEDGCLKCADGDDQGTERPRTRPRCDAGAVLVPTHEPAIQAREVNMATVGTGCDACCS